MFSKCSLVFMFSESITVRELKDRADGKKAFAVDGKGLTRGEDVSVENRAREALDLYTYSGSPLIGSSRGWKEPAKIR